MTDGEREVARKGVTMRVNNRDVFELREINVTTGYISNQPASLLYEQGDTRLICAATFNEKVPFFAKEKKNGWISAEYSMLPYSTGKQRFFRERGRTDGRNIEIQRFIGRALRRCVDLKKIQGFNIMIDSDVVQADGGTRCAAVNGGMIALIQLLKHLVFDNKLYDLPEINPVAAVSVGIKNGEVLVDIDFEEDSHIESDLNIVSNDKGEIIEVQGVSEEGTISLETFKKAVGIGVEKNMEILRQLKKYF